MTPAIQKPTGRAFIVTLDWLYCTVSSYIWNPLHLEKNVQTRSGPINKFNFLLLPGETDLLGWWEWHSDTLCSHVLCSQSISLSAKSCYIILEEGWRWAYVWVSTRVDEEKTKSRHHWALGSSPVQHSCKSAISTFSINSAFTFLHLLFEKQSTKSVFRRVEWHPVLHSTPVWVLFMIAKSVWMLLRQGFEKSFNLAPAVKDNHDDGTAKVSKLIIQLCVWRVWTWKGIKVGKLIKWWLNCMFLSK